MFFSLCSSKRFLLFERSVRIRVWTTCLLARRQCLLLRMGIGAESRWREGIFLGLFVAGHGANVSAVVTPEGVEAARTINLGPYWDMEPLWSVKKRPDGQRQRAEKHCCQQKFLCQLSLEQEEMEGKEEFSARDVCASERTRS